MFNKLVGFIILYTFIYGFIHGIGIININLSDRDLTILVGMYSMMGFIFSVVSGFVIQSKWHIWDKLVEAGHGEIVTLRQMQLMSRHLPVKNGESLRKKIKAYVLSLIEAGDSEKFLDDLEIEAFESGEKVYTQMEKLLYWKEQRANYARRSLPKQLKLFLMGSFGVVATMSVLFTVNNIAVGLIFSGCVATLAYFLHLLVDDLDHPYRPGGWYFSSHEYEQLV